MTAYKKSRISAERMEESILVWTGSFDFALRASLRMTIKVAGMTRGVSD